MVWWKCEGIYKQAGVKYFSPKLRNVIFSIGVQLYLYLKSWENVIFTKFDNTLAFSWKLPLKDFQDNYTLSDTRANWTPWKHEYDKW